MDIRNKANTENQTESSTSRIEELENRQHFSASSADIGINVNVTTSASVAKAIPVLKQMGVTTVRIWAGVNYTDHSMTPALLRAIDYHNAGFDVLVIVNPNSKSVPDASAVKGWFQWAAGQSSLKGAIDRWEVGNEVDSSGYFKGSLQQYMTNELVPAYSALHAAGEKVVSAGVSWNPQDIKTMIDGGLLNYCDFIGFHPYANGVTSQAQHITQLEQIVAGRKPLVASEWNIRGYENDKTAWSQAVEDAYTQVRDGFAFNYYFCLFVQNTPAGPGAILNSDGSQNTLFWNAFSTFQQQNGNISKPVTPPVVTPIDTGTTGGNTAAGSNGAISGILWNDDNADGVHDSNEKVTGVRTVFIDANGNGKLDAGERTVNSDSKGKFTFSGLKAGTYKVSRLFPAGFRMSNGVNNDLSLTLNAGQQISNANIGTTSKAVSRPVLSAPPPLTSLPTPTQTPMPTQTGPTLSSIAGTLWNDTNGDGVYDADESATGVRTVFIDGNGNGKLDDGEKSTTSDTAGHYSFSGLTAGSYLINRIYPDGYRMSNGTKHGVLASLIGGQTAMNVNLGTTNRAA